MYIPYHADNFEETLELRRWGKCFLRRKMITILTIMIKMQLILKVLKVITIITKKKNENLKTVLIKST